MSKNGHLILHEQSLLPGKEWSFPGNGWLFARVHDGAAYLLGSGSPRMLNPDDTIAATRNSAWQIRASQLGTLRLQYFSFYPEQLTGLMSLTDQHSLHRAEHKWNRAPIVFTTPHSVATQFRFLAELPQPSSSFSHRTHMLTIIAAALNDDLNMTDAASENPLTAGDRFATLVRSLPAQDLASHSVEELSRKCGCSPRHFTRLFKVQFGRSFQEERKKLRLRKACQLLAETDDKIINIAMDCGYQHVGLFCVTFKQHLGVTPSHYRKKNRRHSK
jgi:AraC-like DNA-binding protein